MSKVREVEAAWLAQMNVVVANETDPQNGEVKTATVTSVSVTSTGWSATADAWRWAVLTFTSGGRAGQFRVVTSYAVADGSATFTWREPLTAAPAAKDLFTVSFAPLAGATPFLHQPIPKSISDSELPAIVAAAHRTLKYTYDGGGATSRGTKEATLILRTDLISAWSDASTAEALALQADQLYEQVNQIRLNTKGIVGVTHVDGAMQVEEPSALGELSDGKLVYWSVLYTQFRWRV
jgi:hypothetical protein